MKHLVIAVFFIGVFTLSYGQNSFNSFEELWTYIEKNNTEIQIQQLQEKIAKQDKKEAYTAFMPQISANAGVTDNLEIQTTLIPAIMFGGSPNEYIPVQFGQKYILQAGIQISLDILQIQHWFNTSLQEIHFKSTQNNTLNIKQKLYERTSALYYNYLLLEKTKNILVQHIQYHDSLLSSIENKASEGLTNPYIHNKLLASREMLQIQLSETNTQSQNTRNNVRLLSGLLDIEIKDAISESPSIENSSFLPSPLLKNLELQKRSLNIQQHSITYSLLPSLSLVGNLNYQKNSNSFDPLNENIPWFPGKFISVRANWLIFNGGKRYIQLQKNKLLSEQIDLNIQYKQQEERTLEENTKAEFVHLSNALEKSRKALDLYKKNVQIQQNKYEEGLIPMDDYVNSYIELLNQEQTHVNLLAKTYIAKHKISVYQKSFEP